MENIERYRRFCKEKNNIPIFSKDWWLDAVCGESNWDVLLYEKSDTIVASMPYCKKKKIIFKTIWMPKLTQTMGPYIIYPIGQKYEKKLSFEKEIMNYFIAKLPDYDYFFQHFHYNITNWLPFYWKGFKQTTRYTYVIENIQNLEDVFKSFNHAKRKQIKKAEQNNIIVTQDTITPKEFYELHKKELLAEDKNNNIAYEYSLLKKIYESCQKQESGSFFVARDSENNVHGALLIIWDKASSYNLISAFDPVYFKSGATSLLIKESIRIISSLGIEKFDLEGSMIEGVEHSFKQFGATQKAYFRITKANNILIKVAEALK